MRGRGDSGRAKGWIESEYERHKQMRRKKSGTCILEGMSTAIVVPACSERSRERETHAHSKHGAPTSNAKALKKAIE